ncbi:MULTISPECIES: hypothetical protein [unclassified Pseudofrankia]|uniref:hypothetical protein n=1 Tax=unclassified Pseudofrankia TaxID=2994372 RepID=UPI0008DA704C|nr:MULTISPECIES: hypothetical protein [unclassified Pseudofrankia]MDT3440900.1 hypothetical protein [Pseudofrankia sp. BMG5.37]OHV65771.1 hypothetical protein BCD48_36270 [Pseudofrankia sp. BMG5.36]
MDEDVMDLPIEADLLEEGLALLPPRTTEYRSGAVSYPWAEEPVTQPIRLPLAVPAPLASPVAEL